MSSPTFVTIDPDVVVHTCPFCGGKPALYSIEPHGHWGDGYHPKHDNIYVSCRVCAASGPTVECSHFADWDENTYTVEDFRCTEGLWQREHDKWVVYRKAREQEAIDKWNKRI